MLIQMISADDPIASLTDAMSDAWMLKLMPQGGLPVKRKLSLTLAVSLALMATLLFVFSVSATPPLLETRLL